MQHEELNQLSSKHVYKHINGFINLVNENDSSTTFSKTKRILISINFDSIIS